MVQRPPGCEALDGCAKQLGSGYLRGRFSLFRRSRQNRKTTAPTAAKPVKRPLTAPMIAIASIGFTSFIPCRRTCVLEWTGSAPGWRTLHQRYCILFKAHLDRTRVIHGYISIPCDFAVAFCNAACCCENLCGAVRRNPFTTSVPLQVAGQTSKPDRINRTKILQIVECLFTDSLVFATILTSTKTVRASDLIYTSYTSPRYMTVNAGDTGDTFVGE